MSIDPNELDVLELAQDWAHAEGIDTDEWEEDDFHEFFYNEVEWEIVASVHWRSGRFAGVKFHGGVFLAYDDAETYGPFANFEEAHRKMGVDDSWDGISQYFASPLFQRKQ